MAQSGYTPILIYGSGTTGNTPSAGNLTSSAAGAELALNYFDGRLFYKDNAGVVQILAVKMPSGIMPVANGGTGLASYAVGDLLYATGATTLAKLTVGAASTILTSSGTAPQWTAGSSVTVGIATNLAGGVAGSLPYQTGANTTTFLGIGAANRVLTSTGSAPQWVTSLTGLTGVSSSGLTNTSLTSGRVVYSTTGGAQTDSVNLTFDGSTLTVNSVNVGRGAGSVASNTAVGATSLNANTTGTRNTAVGTEALFTNTTNSDSTALGYRALYLNTGSANTAVGSGALDANTTGDGNAALGFDAAGANTTGQYITAIGSEAAKVSTGIGYLTAIGRRALFSNTTGYENVAVGTQALAANTTGINNVSVGDEASISNTTGYENVAVGYRASRAGVATQGVVAVGFTALLNNTASYSTAVGGYALRANTSGSQNTAVGGLDGANAALMSNTTGSFNVAVGNGAVSLNSTGSNNTGLGYQALRSNTTASSNTAVGYQAAYSNTTGVENTALGYRAGFSNTAGETNIFIGSNAGYTYNGTVNTGNNAVIGSYAGYSMTSGVDNVIIGGRTAYSLTTGSRNVIIGRMAGHSLTSGTYNTFIGPGEWDGGGGTLACGGVITTGSKNSILGRFSGNQGGLDIRTSSNNIVLSDGDGNPRLYINSSGNAGLATASPSYLLSLGGDSARTVGMERHTTADTAGNNLTLLAGGATSGATDKNGGNLVLSSGTATGSGSSIIQFLTTTAGAAGTADRSPTEKMRLDGPGRLSINTVSPTAAAMVTVVANASASGNAFRSVTTIADATSGVTQTGNGAPLIINTSGLNANQNVTALAINTQGFANGNTGQNLELNNLSTLLVNDRLGSILFGGNDGSSIRSGAAIQSFVDSAVSVGNMPARLIFATNGTERMRLPAAGGVQAVTTISVGNATPAASGAGITFPATQSASSDANTLDDYEEGTWTATITPATSGTITLSSTADLMSYTKIGRQVTVTGLVIISSVSSPVGASVSFGGLPFTSGDFAEFSERSTAIVQYFDFNAAARSVLPSQLSGASASFEIWIDASTLAANDEFVISLTYFV